MPPRAYIPLAAALLLLLAAGLLTSCSAQDETAVEPSTLYWGLSEEWPFADIHWRTAFADLVDEAALVEAAGAASGTRFVSHEERVRQAAEQPGSDDPELMREVLFIAGAVERGGRVLPLRELGPCFVWIAPDGGVGPSDAERLLLATGLAQTQRQAIIDVFRLTTAPCEVTSDAAAAHILIWAEGETPPLLPCREQSSFIGVPGETGLGVTCP
ncbi:MAG: hypothetical protein O2895_06245 [Chloroflexi bacterium]|nr:hypothetical protein [Chloroflexota bacterium]